MSGTIIFNSNVSEPSGTPSSVAGDDGLLSTSLAASFSTGGTATLLTDVQVSLEDSTASTDGGTITVTLMSDNGTAPDSVVGTLEVIADSSLATTNSLVDISVSSLALAANTRYWIELTGDSNATNAAWSWTADDSGPGVASEFDVTPAGLPPLSDTGGAYQMIVTACFAAGTRILTSEGEVPVERLSAGDLVAVLREGGLAPVRWIGFRRADCRSHPRPEDVWPIRIAPGAFGPGRPRRELMLSPDHAVHLTGDAMGPNGVLIPIRYLVNGATIVQIPADTITYYHVELEKHDVLLAEGMPAESYLDTGNRSAFSNGDGAAMAHPDFALGVWARDSCAPLVLDGPQLLAARARTRRHAEALGHVLTMDADLHLVVDGVRIDGVRGGAVYDFALPEAARDVWLVSRSASPAETGDDIRDRRRLGVAVHHVAIDGITIPPSTGPGWHAAEPGWQWTQGPALLNCAGAREVEVKVALVGQYWVPCERRELARAA